jgi:hypothetical protein
MLRGASCVSHGKDVVQRCVPNRVLDAMYMYCQLSTARCQVAMNALYCEKEIAFWFFVAIASLLQVRDYLQIKALSSVM